MQKDRELKGWRSIYIYIYGRRKGRRDTEECDGRREGRSMWVRGMLIGKAAEDLSSEKDTWRGIRQEPSY